RGAWLHVDGAFGLWAAASPALRHRVAGVELADSWATDAHKWLNVPYDSGLAIVADASAHRAAMSVTAAYLISGSSDQRDPLDWTPEFSRRARGFPIYATLRALGRQGVAQLIERCCALARRMAERLAAAPRVTVLNDVVLNQVLVRFQPPPAGDADAFTRAVVERVQRDGTCWLSGTTWQGKGAMRISVCSSSTSPSLPSRSPTICPRSRLETFPRGRGTTCSPASNRFNAPPREPARMMTPTPTAHAGISIPNMHRLLALRPLLDRVLGNLKVGAGETLLGLR